jgi:hypothetical protein
VIPVSREELIQTVQELRALIGVYDRVARESRPLVCLIVAARANLAGLKPGVCHRADAVLIRCQQEQEA